jgi:hypothetical protein
MIREQLSSSHYARLASGMLTAAMFMACGSEPTTATTPTASNDDAAAAYAALSASLQDCQDAQDTCETAAAGDATKLAACDADAKTCTAGTKDKADHAHSCLRNAAEGCFKGSHHDDDGGVRGHNGPGMRGCFGGRAPAVPACVDALFTCLENVADQTAVDACVETAHTCLMAQAQSHSGDHGHGSAGGAPSFPGGGPGHAWGGAGGAPVFPGSGNHAGAGDHEHHDRAGAEAPSAAGEGGGRRGGRGPRGGSAGAAGSP